MIFMPPRHGKSEMVTVRYTAWRLLLEPELRVIVGSYAQQLANRFSRSIKRVCDEVGFGKTSDDEKPIAGRLKSAAEWETPAGGGVRAVGVGAGVTGFGAGLIVIDDPVKNRAQADSETYRERTWDWFNDDIYTRLEPDASIILIQTRWHEDDLAGRLIREEEDGGEKWTTVNLPAVAEPDDPLGRVQGAPLCRARFDRKALDKIRRKLGSYSFSALYQQRPVPRDKGMFKREWFRNIVDEAPDGLHWKRGYDLAVSTKTSADYTASFRCARDERGNVYIADGYRARIEYPDQRRYVIERMTTEKNTEHGIEAALHGKALVQDLRQNARLIRTPFRGIAVEGDKLMRALPWLNLAEEGRVILVRGAWIDEFLHELSQFPKGRHDDQIDAVSIAFSMLDRRGTGAVGV